MGLGLRVGVGVGARASARVRVRVKALCQVRCLDSQKARPCLPPPLTPYRPLPWPLPLHPAPC